MIATNTVSQVAMKFETEVHSDGTLELQVPSVTDERVIVFVIPEVAKSFDVLTAAAQSSLEFCDYPLDDEGWNSTATYEGN